MPKTNQKSLGQTIKSKQEFKQLELELILNLGPSNNPPKNLKLHKGV